MAQMALEGAAGRWLQPLTRTSRGALRSARPSGVLHKGELAAARRERGSTADRHHLQQHHGRLDAA